MPVNFFDERAKTNSSNTQFGLCDDPPPAKNPAYIDEYDQTKWIGIVSNQARKSIDFYPIDNCIPVMKANNELERRCDGMLRFESSLFFVELKTGEKGWLGVGREQLTISIQKFQQNHDLSTFTKIEAFICNSSRPVSKSNYMIEIQKFKNDTGYVLNVQQKIEIDK